MNALLLTSILIAIVFINLFLSNGDIFSPAVLMSGSYLIGATIVFLHNGFSEYDISLTTAGMIITFVVVFCVFFYLMSGFSSKDMKVPPKEIKIGKGFVLFSIIIDVVSIARVIAVYSGLTGIAFSLKNPATFIWNGKYAADTSGFSNGIFWGSIILFSYTLLYIYAYSCVYDKMIKREKIKKIKFVPILLSVACEVMQAGRIWLIQLMIYALFLIYLFSRKTKTEQSNYKRSFKIMIRIIESIALFWILFTLMGTLKFQHYSKPFDTFYGYTGASYLVFEGVKKNILPTYSLNDSYILTCLYSLLNHFGFSFQMTDKFRDLYMETGKGLVSNIIPAFGRYYLDFGYLGMLIISFMLGAISGIEYKKINKRTGSPTFIFMYASIVQCIALQFIAEQFFLYMLSVSFLIPLVEFYLVQRLLSADIVIRVKKSNYSATDYSTTSNH